MTFDALNYSWIVFLVAAEGIIYDRDWYQWNQTIVYIVRCVYHIALAGLGCEGIPDMTCQVKLWKALFTEFFQFSLR